MSAETNCRSGSRNQQIVGKPRPEFVLARDNDGNLIIEPNRLRLSACLIIHNNGYPFTHVLESLRPSADCDGMIIVDTGSRDATPPSPRNWEQRSFIGHGATISQPPEMCRSITPWVNGCSGWIRMTRCRKHAAENSEHWRTESMLQEFWVMSCSPSSGG